MREINLDNFDLFIAADVENDAVPLSKTIETIEGYGFRGHSRGGRNGIFLLNSSRGDRNLERSLARFEESPIGREFLETNDNGALTPIKIVTHRDDDKRAIGYIDRSKLYLVKVGSY